MIIGTISLSRCPRRRHVILCRYTGKDHNSLGKWQSAGLLCEAHEVTGGTVICGLNSQPVAVVQGERGLEDFLRGRYPTAELTTEAKKV